MKKLLLLAVAGLFVLSSCKKDWTCECNLKATYGNSTQKIALPLTNQTKSSATTQCDAAKTNYSSFSIYSTVDCELK